MSLSQILAITDIATNQNNKETTHNNAVRDLEQATNQTLVEASVSAGPWTLSESEFTRNFIFKPSGASGAFNLVTPDTVNAVAVKRVFAVYNADTTYACTVKATSAGTTVVLSAGEGGLFYQIGVNVYIVLRALPSGTNTVLTGSGAPGGGTGSDGDIYIDTATTTFYGPKAAGTWPTGVPLIGPGYTATSTTSLSITAAATRTFTTQAGLAYSVGARVRATSVGGGDYMEGVVTDYTGTALEVLMDYSIGSGTHADWNINLAGDPALVTGSTVAYDFSFFGSGTFASSQYVAVLSAARAFDIPADFAGSSGKCITNPTATATFTVKKNGVSIGTVAISTGGVFTFSTSATPVSVAVNDSITVQAPGVVDGTLADVGVTFKCTRVV